MVDTREKMIEELVVAFIAVIIILVGYFIFK